MSKKQAEFWVALLVLCIIVATAILLVDFGIKSSILEESNRLWLKIEEWEVRQSGRKPAETNADGATNIAPNDPPFPSDVLVVDSTRMETGSASNGDQASRPNPRKRRTKPSGQASPRTIPDGD